MKLLTEIKEDETLSGSGEGRRTSGDRLFLEGETRVKREQQHQCPLCSIFWHQRSLTA